MLLSGDCNLKEGRCCVQAQITACSGRGSGHRAQPPQVPGQFASALVVPQKLMLRRRRSLHAAAGDLAGAPTPRRSEAVDKLIQQWETSSPRSAQTPTFFSPIRAASPRTPPSAAGQKVACETVLAEEH